MAKSYDQQPEQNSFFPPDSGLQGGYPPSSSQSFDGIPQIPGGTGVSKNRSMDRFLGRILTFFGIIALFVLLVVLLKNISPEANTQMDITPGDRPASTVPADSPQSDILGE